jgi:transcriptional regulator CtsR
MMKALIEPPSYTLFPNSNNWVASIRFSLDIGITSFESARCDGAYIREAGTNNQEKKMRKKNCPKANNQILIILAHNF